MIRALLGLALAAAVAAASCDGTVQGTLSDGTVCSALNATACAGTVLIDASKAGVIDDGAGVNMANKAACVWKLTGPAGKSIELSFSMFKVFALDNVTIDDGTTKIAVNDDNAKTAFKTNTLPYIFTSAGNTVTVTLNAASSYPIDGIKLNYRTAVKCLAGTGAPLSASSTSACRNCAKGKYSQPYLSGPCINCPAGRYNAYLVAESIDKCLACGVGKFPNGGGTAGATGCIVCPGGYMPVLSAGEVASEAMCKACPQGKKPSDDGNGNSCDRCPDKSFGADGKTCTPCADPLATTTAGALNTQSGNCIPPGTSSTTITLLVIIALIGGGVGGYYYFVVMPSKMQRGMQMGIAGGDGDGPAPKSPQSDAGGDAEMQ